MPKLKLAPDLEQSVKRSLFAGFPYAKDEQRQLKALLAVARSVHTWFMDEDNDRNESTAKMLRAHDRLERISKGAKR